MKRGKGELAKEILAGLGTGLVISTLIVLPGSAKMFWPILKKFKTKKQNFVRSLKFLKQNRLIDFKQEGNISKIIITEKGKQKLLEFDIDNLKIKKPKRWDGLWRIVTFDIPEKKKLARNALRERLKNLGFVQLHKSVFVYPYPCLDEIQFIEEIFQIGSFVNYIEAREIKDDEWLRKEFDLI